MTSDWVDQRFDELKKLAEDRFSPLSEAEKRVLRAAITGDHASCGPSHKDDDPLNNPSSIDEWDTAREIRAKLLRWLCVDHTAETYVDPQGIWIYGAKISSALKLNFTSVRFPLGLRRCRFTDEIRLVSATLPTLNLSGCAVPGIIADGAKFHYDVFLNDGFSATGRVSFSACQIDGTLNCVGGTFKDSSRDGIEKGGTALTAAGASIKGSVLLRDGFIAEGMVSFADAQINVRLNCENGIFRNPAQAGMPLSGIALIADRATIKGGVHFGNGFLAEGLVSLWGAQIDGVFDCTGSVFKNPPIMGVEKSGVALLAASAFIKGIFFLRNAAAEGLISFMDAQIDVGLECENGTFANPQSDVESSGLALNGVRAKIKGGVHFRNGFFAEGLVDIWGAQIDGILDCTKGTFKNPELGNVKSSGMALNAGGAWVKGNVSLSEGFVAEGLVNLLSAQIDGILDCTGGSFKNPASAKQPSDRVLNAENAVIKGPVFFRYGFVAEGQVNLLGAQVGGDLECHNASFNSLVMQRMTIKRTFYWLNINKSQKTELVLLNTAAGALSDAAESWPTAGNLSLDGFTYGRIAGGPNDGKRRLDWIGRQKSFSAQPYRQLAKILRDEGDDDGARRVIYEMEKRKHQDGKRRRLSKFWNPVFRWTIGYGIYPRRALWWLLLLVVLGWGIYRLGYTAEAMTPTNKETYDELHKTKQLPPHYQRFYASIYSAENSFPLVNLGQRELWTPDPNREGLASFLRLFRWAQIVLGWVLATFFVAGVTGIARKE
jgi:hypothetical protein